MKKKRILRVVLGILLLVLFGAYLYLYVSNSPCSEDVDKKLVHEEENSQDAQIAAPAETQAPEATPEPTPTPEPTVDPNSPEGRAAAMGLPAPPDIDITSWEFLMANPDHSIAEYEPPLMHYETKSMPANIQSNQWGDGLRIDERIEEPFTEFITAAADQGLNVYLSSAYRSFSDQQANFNRKLNEGYSEEAAKKIVAVPGTSEHQTGLAADITDKYYELKGSSLENTELYKWMSAHCAEYGFIVRYPKDKQDITQIIYEPWHFRYVGNEAAEYIMENHICFEEFYYLYTGEDYMPKTE